MPEQNKLPSRSFSDWLSYMQTQHHSSIDLGLTRILKVAQDAGLTQSSARVITVAGTNGKGSSCALLERILLNQGYQVGVYSSPHLIDYRERVRVNGELPPHETFCASFAYVDNVREGQGLSFFEFATLAALRLFSQYPLDFIILEVGLGGRLDATNIIDAEVALVTTVALDHTDWLGDDLAQIGREKAGIFRANGKAVISDPNIVSSVAECAAQLNCNTLQLGVDAHLIQDSDSWTYQGRDCHYAHLPLHSLPLQNAAGVLAVTEQLGLKLTQGDVVKALEQWQINGRMQWLNDVVLVDVAHNPQSAEYLAKQLPGLVKGREVNALVAMLSDKDVAGALQPLKPLINTWYISGIDDPRGDDGSFVAQHLSDCTCQRFASIEAAYRCAINDLGNNQILLIFGSFFTVGNVIELAATTSGKVNEH